MDQNIFTILQRRKKTVIGITILTVLLIFILTIIQPLRYSSTIGVHIIQKTSPAVDVFSALKSAERISTELAVLIYTPAFYDRVMAAGFNIDKNSFSPVERVKRKQWKNMIDTQVVYGTGILRVVVYHQDQKQATEIARAITYVLTTQAREFTAAQDVEIKMIETPLVSRWPVKPNILLNLAIGVILGLALGIGIAVLSSRPVRTE